MSILLIMQAPNELMLFGDRGQTGWNTQTLAQPRLGEWTTSRFENWSEESGLLLAVLLLLLRRGWGAWMQIGSLQGGMNVWSETKIITNAWSPCPWLFRWAELSLVLSSTLPCHLCSSLLFFYSFTTWSDTLLLDRSLLWQKLQNQVLPASDTITKLRYYNT